MLTCTDELLTTLDNWLDEIVNLSQPSEEWSGGWLEQQSQSHQAALLGYSQGHSSSKLHPLYNTTG